MKDLLSVSTIAELKKSIAVAEKDGGNFVGLDDGYNRKIRFEGKSGQLIDHLGNKIVATRDDKTEIVIMGYRTFHGIPGAYGLEGEGKDWCELYYLNRVGAICFLQFHNISVSNFMSFLTLLKHERIKDFTGVKVIVKAEEKTNKASGESYYVLDFEYPEQLGADFQTLFLPIAAQSNLFNPETMSITEADSVSIGFNFKGQLTDGLMALNAPKEEAKQDSDKI